jgi:hypothetical protein
MFEGLFLIIMWDVLKCSTHLLQKVSRATGHAIRERTTAIGIKAVRIRIGGGGVGLGERCGRRYDAAVAATPQVRFVVALAGCT